MNFKQLFIGLYLIVTSCGIYSFTGSSIPVGAETFQVNYFENNSGGKPGSTIEPGLDRDFTIALQDLIVNQTSLSLVNEGGDLLYEGEITEFSITPMAATAEIKAAQNRLTMRVSLNYENKLNEEDNIKSCLFEEELKLSFDQKIPIKVDGEPFEYEEILFGKSKHHIQFLTY